MPNELETAVTGAGGSRGAKGCRENGMLITVSRSRFAFSVGWVFDTDNYRPLIDLRAACPPLLIRAQRLRRVRGRDDESGVKKVQVTRAPGRCFEYLRLRRVYMLSRGVSCLDFFLPESEQCFLIR